MKGSAVARGGIYALGAFVCAATLIPLMRRRRGWIRAFDFPRLQIFGLGTGVLAAGIACLRPRTKCDKTLLTSVAAAAAGQALQIFPYTPLARKEVLPAEGNTEDELLLLFFNVLQSNRKTQPLLELIERHQPSLVLLTETDHWWEEQLRCLERDYPWFVKEPRENTYGMMLFSRHRLMDTEVRHLVKEDTPSIRTQVEARDGRRFCFYGVHPKPPGVPMANGDLRPSGPRDAELVLIAREIREQDGPVLIAGDFNDVAWSHTTRLFKRISRMLDPRVGRGFYNTFPVQWPMLRYPLDHLFHTAHFKLVRFEDLPDAGSDHFPVLAGLQLDPAGAREQRPNPAQPEDKAEARELISRWAG